MVTAVAWLCGLSLDEIYTGHNHTLASTLFLQIVKVISSYIKTCLLLNSDN